MFPLFTEGDMKEIQKAADQLICALKKENFVIHRYESFSTNSIYLKLDYGVGNSIRISDHKGKKYLKYRFNLEVGRKQINKHMEANGLHRFYYPINQINQLVKDIVKERNKKIKKYGHRNYKTYMERNREDNLEKKRGFWSKCWEV